MNQRFAACPICLIALVVGSVLLTNGCESELQPPLGVSIQGRVFLQGEMPEGLARPALEVLAFASVPPTGPPHAMVQIVDPDFSSGEGIPYELEFLRAHDYFLLAHIADLADRDNVALPTGAYPDFCALTLPEGSVSVGAEPLAGHDITMYGEAGTLDPCNAASTDVCPAAGSATLSLELTATVTPNPEDKLLYGAFTSWPPAGFPERFKMLPTTGLTFPYVLIDNEIPPGDLAIYICLDRGGDNTESLCGDGDVWGVFEAGALVRFEQDQVVSLGFDLQTGASERVSVVASEQLGCGDAPAVGAIEVTLNAPDLVIGEGDTVAAALFREYPPPTPLPVAFDIGPAEGFPQVMSLTNLPPGEYFLTACLDRGGDSPLCTGVGDIQSVYMNGEAPVSVVPFETLELALTFEPLTLLEVTADSAGIVAVEGDVLRALVYADYPPQAPALAQGEVALASFPTTWLVGGVAAGEVAIAVCYDAGGDSPECDGAADVLAWVDDGGVVALVDGQTTSVQVTLEP